MRLLLDTHIFLWFVAGSRRLSRRSLLQISTADEVWVSAASVWEAAIKISIGRLEADVLALVKAIPASGFQELSISVSHAAAVASLPPLHHDPFDRLLIAQARTEKLLLLTADDLVVAYGEGMHRA